MSASDHETRDYVRTYLKVFAALMGLTVITVAVTYVHPAIPLAIVVALGIATLKGSLVASFFMHLISERPLVFVALLVTAVLFTALMVLPVLTTNDSIAEPYTPWRSAAPAAANVEP